MEIRRNKWSFIHLMNVGGNYEVTVHKHKAGLTENRSWEIWSKALPTLTLKCKTGQTKCPGNICCHLAQATNRSCSTQTILSAYCWPQVSSNLIAVLALTPKENTGSAISHRLHLNVKCRQIYHANGFKVKPKATTGLHLSAFSLALKLYSCVYCHRF